MSKKLLCTIFLVLALVCALASCDDNKSDSPSTPEPPAHTHAFGEWEITKGATSTTEGSKERYCSCGEKQTAAIPKIEETTQTITSLECYTEIESYLNVAKNLKSVSYIEAPYIYTIYYDGQEIFLHSVAEKEGDRTEKWYGKVGSVYVEVVHKTSDNGSSQKYYYEISETTFNEHINYFREHTFEHVEDLLDVINEGENFECLKKTSGEKVTYVIKAYIWGDTYTFKLEINNGIIIRYELVGEYEVTYPTDITVTIPSLSSFEKR